MFNFDAKVAGNGPNVRNNSTEDCDGFTDNDGIEEVKKARFVLSWNGGMESYFIQVSLRILDISSFLSCYWEGKML